MQSTKTRSTAKAREVTVEELVTHFRERRESLRTQWVQAMMTKDLLSGLTEEEVHTESTAISDTCVGCLETGKYDDAESYAKRMTERGALRGMMPEQILAGMLTLRDVYGRSLFERYRRDPARLLSALDAYEPVASRIVSIIAVAFVAERERVVRQQQDAMREMSTPVLQIREGLLLLPIIGLVDSLRARQLTEQLLRSIRAARAKVAVVDITGVPVVDSKVANHLLQTISAAQLMGAKVIVTGLSAEIATTLVAVGVDLSKIHTLCDLQGGIDEADRLLGYRVLHVREETGRTQ